MVRRWPRPGLISGVSIIGFDVGIDIAHMELSTTLDKVQIKGSRLYGIRNTSNVVSFCDLQIVTQGGYGLANVSSDGLVVGIGGHISGRGVGAFLNKGTVNLKDVVAQDFTTTGGDSVDARLDGIFQATDKISDPKWQLPILSAPEPEPVRTEEWVNIKNFGAVADPKVDSTDAFIAAFRSTARVIYIPTGQYLVTRPIPVGDNIERIEGMFSNITTGNNSSTDGNGFFPLFYDLPSRKKTLFLRRTVVERQGNMSFIVEHRSNTSLVMSDIVGLWGGALLSRPREGGSVFAENIAGGHIRLVGDAGVWLRQLNTEGVDFRVFNSGSPLWILGAKTEDTNTLVRNLNGANTEVVGALIYRVYGTLKQRPLFVNENGRLVASYAEEAFRPDAFYAVHLDSRIKGEHRVINAEEFPRRGPIARMVPSLSTDDLPH
jgi:hypothetical protein